MTKRQPIPGSRRGRSGRGIFVWPLVAPPLAPPLLAPLLAPFLAAALAQPAPPAPGLVKPRPASVTTYQLEPLASELRVPVNAVPLDDTGAMLVVALDGFVLRFQDGALHPTPFLSLAGRVTGLLGEQGFFSIALEPAAGASARGGDRQLVAAFTEAGSGDLVVAAYPLLPDLSGALAAGEQVLLRQSMPEPFHHGGEVAFGPDGLLYVSVGDGQRDPRYLFDAPHASQDLTSLRGKVLRIDPFPAGSDAPYAVPADNPFTAERDPAAAAAGALPEIWAYGFRNPWKFAFAPSDGALLVSDVGEDRWEEIDDVRPGRNYGWPAREGPECLLHMDDGLPVDFDCEAVATEPPIGYYGHPTIDPGGGFSITGGVEVVDPWLPGLLGRYVFGDFVTGRLWSLDRATGEIELLLEGAGAVAAIVNGPNGELFVLDIGGKLGRLAAVP